jgi:hypothetical protein
VGGVSGLRRYEAEQSRENQQHRGGRSSERRPSKQRDEPERHTQKRERDGEVNDLRMQFGHGFRSIAPRPTRAALARCRSTGHGV